jgi:hypothetical protein
MKKWLKIAGVVGVVALIASLLAGVAWAQGPVDEDGDGACDASGQTLGDGFLARWRDRLMDLLPWRGRGAAAGDGTPCEAYVDEDGDGVCDLYEERWGDGAMPRWGTDPETAPQWQGRGPGAGSEAPGGRIVDEDGDGVCDLHGETLANRPYGGRMGAGSGGRGRMGR